MASNTTTSAANRVSSRRLIPIDRSKDASPTNSPDEGLWSALMAQDRELSNILNEVDEVSKAFKWDGPQIQALSKTLQRAVSCAVKQSLLDRELRSLALIDDLTGFYNRRAFLVLAAQQLRMAIRKNQGLWLFFADVDYLKEINDTHGHGEGDLALVRTADALEQTFRDSDILARLGGDEFAVLALEASSQHKNAIIRRLEKKLKASNTGKVAYELSLSIGAARFDPKKPVSLEQLLTQADQSMYHQKKERSRYGAAHSMHG
ncbi:MAG: GGDEF domain-containing protein [Candidatus Acidiferrales bacterium]